MILCQNKFIKHAVILHTDDVLDMGLDINMLLKIIISKQLWSLYFRDYSLLISFNTGIFRQLYVLTMTMTNQQCKYHV